MQRATLRGRPFRRTGAIVAAIVALATLVLPPAGEAAEPDLTTIPIEDLMQIEVTSVSKRAQPLGDAAAAVYVISNEEIRRSGVTSVPEALRLVPGLHVARIDSSRWAITARGFNSQFANKLLVMIDGRTVYTHLFSGVFWDVQDLMLEDIDRIEVIRGPGGTLWGANAVNGVVNIITKSAKQTTGWLAAAGGGTLERAFGNIRYGTRVGDDAHARAYVKYFDRDNFDTPDGEEANDAWHIARGGFRVDWDLTPGDALTLQGEYYDGDTHSTLLTLMDGQSDISGGHVIGRWKRVLSDASDVSLNLYYDRTERDVSSIIAEDRNTLDVELENRVRIASHDLIWGLGYRWMDDDIGNSAVIVFDPTHRTDNLFSGFVQDEIGLFSDRLRVTIGTKFEHNDYTGFEAQPNARILWLLGQRHRVWAAVSRAVRTPSRADDDVTLIAPGDDPGVLFLVTGDRNFDSEVLIAYELGYRAQVRPDLSVDIATYYNDYDKLRSAVVASSTDPPFAPGLYGATFDNDSEAIGYGVELATNWTPTEYWTLAGTYTLMELDLDANARNVDALSDKQEHDTPHNQLSFRSRLDLPRNLEFDLNLFWVDDVVHQEVDDYVRLDLRLGWRPIESIELSLVGQNLTDRRHDEYGSGFFTEHSSVPRSMYGKVTWRY